MNTQLKNSNLSAQFNALFWQLQLGGWALFTLINLAGRQYFVHFHFSELVNSVVLGFCLIISTCLLRKYYQRKLKSKQLLTGFIQILFGSIVAGLVTMLLFVMVIVPNQEAIFQSSPQVSNEQLFQQIMLGTPMVIFLIFAWSALYAVFKKQQQLKQSEQEQVVLDQSLKVARLDVLLSQLNPHFIFNAINNIRALILEDSEKARDMLADLSEVMRYTMQIDKETLIPFSEEIEVVKQYIALNKLQFEDKLLVRYDLSPETLNLSLPPMILQLLIENAIKHGIGKLKQGGEIVIASKIMDNHWQITVENSGTLKTPSAESSRVGLTNIKQRLSLVYGDQSAFSLNSVASGVKACISLPL